tara:strand:- start:5408 stop:5998 length:591 start_codon:yes stop_codon:yes gene_type:complete
MLDNFKSFLLEKCGVDEESYAGFEPTIIKQDVKKGENLLKSGNICNKTFFVEKGLLRIHSLNEEGHINILLFAPEGWIAADRGSFLFNLPSVYFIDAIEDTQVVILDNPFLDLLSEINPHFRRLNERLIQNHVRHLNTRITSLLGDSAESRYLKFIKLYPDILLRVPQWMVASYLGITPESLSRVRKSLSTKNFNS